MQRRGSLQTGISACESCVSSGAWRHAPLKKKNDFKHSEIILDCFYWGKNFFYIHNS